jgi:hypothetical protein
MGDAATSNDYLSQEQIDEVKGYAVTNPAAYRIPNVEYNRQQLSRNAGLAGLRQAPLMGPTDQSQSNEWRARQTGLADLLTNQAQGWGVPTAAQGQLQRATDANISQAMALGASQRGAGHGGALRAIANQTAGAQQQAAGDSAMLRMQEQQGAQNQLGQLLSGARGQDLSQAGMAQQGAMANQSASLQQQQLNNQMVQYFTSMGMQLDQAQQAAAQALDAAKAQRYGLMRGLDIQSQGQTNQLIGAGLAAGGSAIAAGAASYSDERLKKDIKGADDKTYSFLDALNASKYRYKDEDLDDGERVSVMAQELEKSELGKGFVFETPRGKAVDYGKGLGTLLAAQSSLHKRLKALEGSE